MRSNISALARWTVVLMMTCAAYGQKNGATLAACKTLDSSVLPDNYWRYSGVITVWNAGCVDARGTTLADFIEYKALGLTWVAGPTEAIPEFPTVVPAGTTQFTALAIPYKITGQASTGAIRNKATINISNHSRHLNTPFGPNSKATYSGPMPPPACPQTMGCVDSQRHLKSTPGFEWPAPYDRDAGSFLGGKT